jgi:hypothetical protein
MANSQRDLVTTLVQAWRAGPVFAVFTCIDRDRAVGAATEWRRLDPALLEGMMLLRGMRSLFALCQSAMGASNEY